MTNPSFVRTMRGRSIFASFVATLILLAGAFVAIAAPHKVATLATSWTVGTAGTFNWSQTSAGTWNGGPAGQFPGQLNDAIVTVGNSATINVTNAINFPVELHMTGSGTVNVSGPGGTLTLESSSTVTTNNTLAVNGGTLTVPVGTSLLITSGGHFNVNSGEFANTGTVTVDSAGSQMNLNGGRINGIGTTQIDGTLNIFSTSGSPTIDNDQLVQTSGTGVIAYSPAAGNPISIINGSRIRLASGSFMNLGTNEPINGNGAIDVLAGGTLTKSSGGGQTVINTSVNNAGTVRYANTAGTLALANGGTHSGAWNNIGSAGITFSGGTQNFNAGSVMDNTAVVAVSGASTVVNDNAGLTFNTLNLQNGALGGGSLTSVTTFNWSGGDLNGLGTLGVSGTTTINPSAATSHVANGRTLKVQGGGSYAPSGAGSLSLEGLMQTSGAVFGLQGSAINAVGTTGKIEVVGSTLANKVATLDVYPLLQVDNGGTFNANSIPLPAATVLLHGGMTLLTNSTLTVPLNTTLDLAGTSGGNSFDFDNTGNVSCPGKLRISGSSIVNLLSANVPVSNFEQDGTSTLKGTGGIIASSTYAYKGGTMTNSAGTISGATAVMSITPNFAEGMNGGNLLSTGGAVVNFTPGVSTLTLSGGSHILINGTGDTFNINGSSPTISGDSSASINVVPAATMNVPATGTTTLGLNLITSGATNITGGLVDLTKGCSLSGSVNVAGISNALELVSGSHAINAGSTFTGAGVLRLNGGTLLTPNTPYVLPVHFEQSSPGFLSTGADFRIGTGKTFQWHGGTINQYQAGGQLSIASGATLDLTSLTAAASLNNTTLVNAGTINYAPGVQSLTLTAGTLNNSGTFDFKANGSLLSTGAAQINNTGTFQKSTTTGTGVVLAPFANSGSGFLNVLLGTLSLDGGGSMTNGTITVGSTSNLDFNGASKTFTISGGTMTTTGTLNVRAGTVNVNTPLAIGNLGLYGGTLVSPVANSVGGSVVWDGGTLDGAGSTTMTNPSASFTLGSTNPSLLSGGHAFHMKGSGTYNGNVTNYLKLSASTFQVDSGATLTLPAQSLIDTTGSSTVINAGTINSNATAFHIAPAFDNGGTVNVNSGILMLLGGGSESGAFNLADGTLLQLGAGTFTTAGSAAFTATGTTGSLELSGGTLSLGTSVTAPNFIMAGGTVTGAGNLSLAGTSTWTGGAIGGTGTMTNTSGTFSINSAGTLNLNRSFTNGATTSLIGSGLLSVANNAAIVNDATWSMTSSMGVAGVAGTSFTNSGTGTMTKSSGPTSIINMPFANQGLLQLTSGTGLQLLGDGTHTGTFQVTSGVFQLVSGNHTFTGTSSTTGAGQFRIDSPATATFASGATYAITGLTGITGGTLSFASAASTAVLDQNGGTLQGSGNVTIAGPGPSTWLGGSMLGTGHTILAAGVTMNATAALAPMSIGSSRTFDNNGTFHYATAAANGLSFDNGATWNNNAGAMLDLQSDVGIGSSGTAPIAMTNAGTLQKSAGTGTTNIPASLNNSGVVNALTGTLLFSNGYSQSAGTTLLAGGTLNASSVINLNGGQLRGSGNISSINNVGGTVAPGDVANTGILNVNGTFAQGGSGTTAIRLGGPAATQFDQVAVTGAASFAGNLTVTSKGGYVPTTNPTFPIVTYASHTGSFNPPALPALGTGGFWQVNYDPAALDLVATFTSNDIGSSITAPAAVAHGQSFLVQLAVINVGVQNATNVTLSATFGPGGPGANPATIVSTAPPAGMNCTQTASTISCTMPSLATGATATIDVTLTATNVSNLVIGNSVSASEPDPNAANDTTAATVSMQPGSNLGVLVTDSPDPVVAGAALSYTVAVSNGGPDATSGASVVITLPGGATSVAAGGSGWSCTTLSATQLQCTSAAIVNSGSSYPNIAVTMNAPTSGATATLSATVSANAPNIDPAAADDTASQSTTIMPATADVRITKTGPAASNPGGSVTFAIVVSNNGPTDALNVTLDDPAQPALTFVSSTGGGCLQFPCALGTLTPGQSVSVDATYTVAPNASGSVTNTATATTSTNDPSPANNSASATVTINACPSAPSTLLPANNASNVPTTGKLQWIATGAPSYNVYLGTAGSGCSTFLGATAGTSMTYFGLLPGVKYEWRVEAVLPGCPQATASCTTFTTASTTTSCNTAPPVPQSPASGAVLPSPATFQWSPVSGATSYDLYVGSAGSPPEKAGSTSGTSFTADVANGATAWHVVANTGGGCGALTSQTIRFTVCGLPAAPIPAVVSESTSGQTYSLTWDPVPGASQYEVTEATNASFSDGFTQTVAGTSASFTHQATTAAQPFFSRVRAIADCNQQFGPYSDALRTIVIPLPAATQPPAANVPFGSTKAVVLQLFVPGAGPGNFTYFATVDKPWLSIQNPTGILPADGVTLVIIADPSNLPNGTITGTAVVTITNLNSGKTSTNAGSTTSSTPVSINLVTPVSTGAPTAPLPSSLIIPSVGHLDGFNSHWQSDIRVTNTSTDRQKYQLLFTPSGDGSGKAVKSTTIEAGSNESIALDDIVRNWYGIGTLGDSANGVLEIRPLGKAGPAVAPGSVKATAVASSRTYDVTANGTLGQYIPAIPFASFIGKADPKGLQTVLSLQQIAQTEAFRTNVGIVEAGGQPVSVLLSIFDANGIRLKEIPYSLAGGEQKQLNALLASQNITLADGRIEVKVTGGDGKVTAYASVVDNQTNDPLLVSGIPLGTASSDRFVVPGVGDINNALASWRSDLRVFNGGAADQLATVTFYPQAGSGDPMSKTAVIRHGEVQAFDNILSSFFGVSNAGGAVHVTTPANSQLVVTGRTYNQTAAGTLGQFIPAVTPLEAVGKNDRTLQVLQVEDSVRYRTNLGLAEVSGKPVTLDVSVFIPESKAQPHLVFTLGPNEFRQTSLLKDLGLTNTYNARITIRVVDGDGRVTAYGSVVDMATQDPTYVPAQ